MCHPLLRLWRLVEWQALWFKRILCRIWYVTIFFLHIAVKGVNLLSCLFPNRNGSFTRNFDAGRQNLIRLFWCSNHNRRLLTLGVRTLWNILWQADRSKTFLIFFFFFFAGENFLIRTKGRNCIAICHTREMSAYVQQENEFRRREDVSCKALSHASSACNGLAACLPCLARPFLSSATVGLRQHTAFWCQGR